MRFLRKRGSERGRSAQAASARVRKQRLGQLFAPDQGGRRYFDAAGR